MSQPDTHLVTQMLAELREGDRSAFERLLPAVYDELRSLARGYLRRQAPGHTLEPTALVHEAYLRLAGAENADYDNRVHFMAVAATAMRRLLIDHARRDQADKRGGQWQRITLSGVAAERSREIDLLELDAALTALAALDPRQARIVELRYFGGLTIDETAAEMNISTATVEREWRAARAWLATQMSGDRT